MTRADIKFVTIDDFRPGIFTNTANVGGDGASGAQQLGAAVETNTYRCYATPQGLLAPLPRKHSSVTLPQLAQWGDNLEYFITGFDAFPSFMIGTSIAVTSNDDRVAIHFFVVYQDGADYDYIWYRYRIFDTATTTLEVIHSGTETGGDVEAGKSYVPFVHSRMNPSTPTDLGVPVTVAVWTDRSGGGTNFAKAFPNPSSPATNSVIDVGTPASHDQIGAVAHQNRIAMWEALIHDNGANADWPISDSWVWTETNDNSLSSNIATPFVTDNPCDIADAFSTNANELFVVKNQGGGFVVRGSLDNPTVIQLPNLHSLGGARGFAESGFKGVQSSLGPVYAGFDGVYVWEGGDTDRKISNQLDPGATQTDEISGLHQGHRGQAVRWDDWVVFPNNWLFDSVNEAWWKLEDETVQAPVWWSGGGFRGNIYGMDYTIDNTGGAGDREVLHVWRKTQPAYSYSWQSQPLANPDNRRMNIREVVLTFQGDTQDITVTFYDRDGTTLDSHTWSGVASTDRWERLRASLAVQSESITMRIQCDGSSGSNPGAIIRDVALGFDTAQHIPNS